MLREIGNLAAVMKTWGHKHVRTTMRYQHPELDIVRDGLRRLNCGGKTQITDDTAKLIFYSAFIDGKLEAPRTLLPEVHRLYFEPQYPEFAARTMWSLSNAFTSAFKKLDPAPQFKATAKLGRFLTQLPA